ncbi:MAG: hypothetical protein GF411_20475 [Candidatus Lokiarchaeota archaeon]|nr:hypothetical protein [Candidatus Lokiarchaeota archaeon]
MKLNTITEKCNEPHCFYNRNKTNMILADSVRNAIVSGTGRLKIPLKENDISILDIFDAIKSQECIKIINYKPDRSNRHLKSISLGPSYLEQQVSKAIDKAVDNKTIPQAYVPYIRAEIGLDKESKKKPRLTPEMKRKLILKQRKALKEEVEHEVQDLPGARIPVEIPPSRQSEHYSCGATVIQMVSAYYGHNIRESDIIEKLGITKKSGVKLSKIQKVANEMGLKTHREKLSYDNIIKTLDDKIPMVVAVLKENKEYHHFVLIVGYYDDGLIFRDPGKFSYSYMAREEFENRAYGSDQKYLILAMASNEEPEYSPNEVEEL